MNKEFYALALCVIFGFGLFSRISEEKEALKRGPQGEAYFIEGSWKSQPPDWPRKRMILAQRHEKFTLVLDLQNVVPQHSYELQITMMDPQGVNSKFTKTWYADGRKATLFMPFKWASEGASGDHQFTVICGASVFKAQIWLTD